MVCCMLLHVFERAFVLGVKARVCKFVYSSTRFNGIIMRCLSQTSGPSIDHGSKGPRMLPRGSGGGVGTGSSSSTHSSSAVGIRKPSPTACMDAQEGRHGAYRLLTFVLLYCGCCYVGVGVRVAVVHYSYRCRTHVLCFVVSFFIRIS